MHATISQLERREGTRTHVRIEVNGGRKSRFGQSALPRPGGVESEAGPIVSDAIHRPVAIPAGLERAPVRFHQLINGRPHRVETGTLRRAEIQPPVGRHFDLESKDHRNWVVPTRWGVKSQPGAAAGCDPWMAPCLGFPFPKRLGSLRLDPAGSRHEPGSVALAWAPLASPATLADLLGIYYRLAAPPRTR